MPRITLNQAEAKLALWLKADDDVARGQASSVDGRSLTRADAQLIRDNIEYWERRVAALEGGSSGGLRVRYGVPST